MPHGTAAALGFIVGLSLLTLQHHIQRQQRKNGKNRNLASHSSTEPVLRTDPVNETTADRWRRGTLSGVPKGVFKIRTLSHNGIKKYQFGLQIETTGWLSLGISAKKTSSTSWKNQMTGPPASYALVGTGRDLFSVPSATIAVSSITLDDMPPSKSPGAVTKDVGVENATLERIAQKDGKTLTTLSFVATTSIGNHPLDDTVNFIYAYGSNKQSDFQYHTPSRRGALLNIHLSTFAKDGDVVATSRVPYYELHGSFLAFIWSGTTLLGGIIARYGRHYSWWIDAHQFLQTVATVLSFPLTLLSYFAKDGSGSHYSTFHGGFGLIFSLAATFQGTLGSYAHAAFAHDCGLVSKRPTFMANCRFVHRTLGKCMLIVASVQILFGLHSYNPDFFDDSAYSLPWIYCIYVSLTWVLIIYIEVRHQKNLREHRVHVCNTQEILKTKSASGGTGGGAGGDMNESNPSNGMQVKRKKRSSHISFSLITGAGYMTAADIKLNDTAYLDAVECIDEMLKTSNLNVFEMIQEWSNDPLHIHEVKKLTPVGRCCPMRCSYIKGHRSMLTSEILGFYKFLHMRAGSQTILVEEKEEIEMQNNPMRKSTRKPRMTMMHKSHSQKVKLLSSKISEHLIVNRDISNKEQFLDERDIDILETVVGSINNSGVKDNENHKDEYEEERDDEELESVII